MKILYFGTICGLNTYDQLLKECNEKPSVASIVFETALLSGLHANDASVDIHSFPMIPVFPHSHLLYFGGNYENLSCGYTSRWLQTINVPVLRQLSRRMDARRVLKSWLKRNAGDGVVFTYSIPPFMVKDILACAKRYHTKVVAIIPDLLRDMYMNEDHNKWTYKLKSLYLKPALRAQGEYDGYIYLTEPMSEVVAPDKPYMVMEGIADVSEVYPPQPRDASAPRAIMYAGMLHEKYGIISLLDAFEKIEQPDVELWLFGDGTAVAEIRRRAEHDSRIRYFGTVTHDEILDYEKKAVLLVNPRNADDVFTQYSFPSKTIEYMLSGTPLLTTKLKGIPEEYYNYVFTAESNQADALAEGMKRALQQTEEERNAFGLEAQRYIVAQKNAASQSARILAFLEEVVHDNQNFN